MKDDERPPLFTDEHIDPQLGNYLVKMGYDVLTVRQTNTSKFGDGDPDELVIEKAIKTGRVLITCNQSDFESLHKNLNGQHAGIISCPVEHEDDLKKQAKLIHQEIEARGDMRGQFVRIKTIRTHLEIQKKTRRRSACGKQD